MNTETLAALAGKDIEKVSGPLKAHKEKHLELFKKQGLTSPVKDSYKFTNLESFFKGCSLDSGHSSPAVKKVDFPTITFTNGVLSDAMALPAGVSIKKATDHFEQLEKLMDEANALSHLHHALSKEGVIIEIDKNQEIQKPIRILHLLSESQIAAPTILIMAGAFSKATIIEETIAGEVSHARISETYIKAQDGAHLEHITLDQESTAGLGHASIFTEVAKDATVRSVIFHTSGKLNRKNLTLNLNAPGANGESYCLFLTQGHEHSDINTVINHKVADTTSDQMAKGILDGESKGIFTGLIHIFPKAQRVASGQLNKNLLLSKKAQLHSQPQLEIFADDVKCSHGSTTGQLSPDELFYFEARGIPPVKAKTLLAHGFAMEIVNKISNKEAKDFIAQVIMATLETKFNLGRLS